MTSRPAWLVLGLLLLAGCSPKERPVGKQVDFEPAPLPAPAALGYPEDDEGRFVASEVDGVRLTLDPTRRRPIDAVKKCQYWLTECFLHEAHERTEQAIDDCFRSAPRCDSSEPWKDDALCCPAACYAQYARLRRDGKEARRATEAVLLGRSCFPGLGGHE